MNQFLTRKAKEELVRNRILENNLNYKEKFKYKKDPMSSYVTTPYNEDTKKSMHLGNINKYTNVQMTPKNVDNKLKTEMQ